MWALEQMVFKPIPEWNNAHENQIQCAGWPGWRVNLQQDNNPKHAAERMQGQLWKSSTPGSYDPFGNV